MGGAGRGVLSATAAGLSPDGYARWRDSRLGAVTERLERDLALELAGALAGRRVLDVGCGSGRDLLWLKKRGFRVKGFEWSAALAVMARRHADCEVREGDFTSHDFSAMPADAVILIGALVHVPHADFACIFGRIAAALKNGGLVLITLKEGADRAAAFHCSKVLALLTVSKKNMAIIPRRLWTFFKTTLA